MEMPINVMIVMFVAIAVGIGVIGFAEFILTDARDDLRGLGQDRGSDAFSDRLTDVNTLNRDNLDSLARQCVRDLRDSVGKELCFAIRTDNLDVSGFGGEVVEFEGDEWTYVDDVQGNPNIVLMYINGALGNVILES